MKYKKILGLTIASLLALTGCSSIPKDNGKDVIASIQDKNILADDIYNQLAQSAAGKNALFSLLLDNLVKAHFPATKDMETNANELIKSIQNNFEKQYGENAEKELENALASDGYNNLNEYKDSLVYSLQMAEFLKTYVKDHFDTVFNDYYKQQSPRYISLIKIAMEDPKNPTNDESEKLNEVKSLLKTNKSFESIASEYSDDTTKSANGKLGIVDSTRHLEQIYGDEINEIALGLKEKEVSNAIQGNDGYYFLYCSSTNKEQMKKELKTIDVDSPLLAYDDYLVYYAFQTYKIEYNDVETEKTIQSIINESLKAREKSRGGKS